MLQLNIINFGNVRTDKNLEDYLVSTYPFLEPHTDIEDNLVSVQEDGRVDAWEIVGELVERDGCFLVVTSHPLYEEDMYYPEYEYSVPGLSFYKPPHKIALLSTNDLNSEHEILRDSAHEIGHWFGLKNHEPNWRNIRQCVMVLHYAISDETAENGLGIIGDKGLKLCGLCQWKLDPNYQGY